jgi:hypothetical protein
VPLDPELQVKLSRDVERLQLVFFLETAHLRPRPLAVSRVDQKTVLLDVQSPGYERVRYTVDMTTRLPRSVLLTRILSSGQPAEMLWSLRGLAEVDGLKMPRHVEALGDVEFLINPAIDPALFGMNSTSVATADAWRRWLRR